MRRLRSSDGTPAHRRTARYHVSRCKLGTAPIHTTLTAEMSAKAAALVTKARAAEDTDDTVTETGAAVDAAEIAVENTIRELDGALVQVDRDNPQLGAQAATFPEGFGAVIDPEGGEQLKVLPALLVRVDPFKAEPTIAPVLAKLATATATFKTALTAAKTADEAYDAAFAEEVAARTAVREQLESAYGRLRDFYKARPALAEGFFLKDGGARSAAKKDATPPNGKAAKQPNGQPGAPAGGQSDNQPGSPPV